MSLDAKIKENDKNRREKKLESHTRNTEQLVI